VAAPGDTSDPEPCFIEVSGVKPREATAEGGLGLTPLTPMQAQSTNGWDNVLGNDVQSNFTLPRIAERSQVKELLVNQRLERFHRKWKRFRQQSPAETD
jgi:hypothetical protein